MNNTCRAQWYLIASGVEKGFAGMREGNWDSGLGLCFPQCIYIDVLQITS